MFGSESNAPLKMVWFRKIILTAGLRGDFLQKFDISVLVNAIVRYRNSNLGLMSYDSSQCARTDLNKKFLPKPMTTTG